ncbi:MAG TPA: hypothetical protein VJR89_15435 [Polyangiales bacterium]|nr:hypothetical protein [Polyangiales bacterium]
MPLSATSTRGKQAWIVALVASLAAWTPVSGARAEAPGAPQLSETAEQQAPEELEAADEELPHEPLPAGQSERAILEQKLRDVQRERETTTNFWPWLALSVSIATLATGTVAGVASTLGCERGEGGCSSPPWASLVVVLGATMGALSAVWLVRTDRGIAELEIKQEQLKYDLRRLEAGRLRRMDLADSSQQLQLRMSF